MDNVIPLQRSCKSGSKSKTPAPSPRERALLLRINELEMENENLRSTLASTQANRESVATYLQDAASLILADRPLALLGERAFSSSSSQ
jgi:ABC-type phosphate/phosphonate transport system ATPase subunit